MRKLAIVGGGIIGVFAVIMVILGALADETAFQKTLIDTLSQHTGRAVAVNGGTDVSLFPLPAITMKEVFIGNISGGYAGYIASAKAIHGRLQLGALLKGEIKLGSLVIDDLEVNLEVTSRGEQNWRFGSQAAPAPSGGFEALGIPSSIRVSHGTITVQTGTAEHQKRTITIDDTRFDIDALPQLHVEAELTYDNGDFQIVADFSDINAANGTIRGSITAEGSNSTLAFDGTGRADLFAPSFTGNASLQSDDAGNFAGIFLRTTCNRTPEAAPVPATVTGKVSFTPDSFSAENISVSSGPSKVEGSGAYTHDTQSGQRTLQITLSIPSLDLDPLLPEYFRFFGAGCRPQVAAPAERQKNTAFDMSTRFSLLPDNMEARFSGTAQQIRINRKDITGVTFNAQANGGSIVINQLTGKLPGETNLSAFGLLSQRADSSLTFDGGMETSGQRLREILEWLNAPLNTRNPAVLGGYALKATFALSGTEIRLTEASGNFDQTRFAGVTVTNFGANPSSEIRVRFDQFNLDDYLPPDTNQANTGLEIRGTGTANPVDWIHRVTYLMRFGIGGNQFTFRGRQYGNLYAVGSLEKQTLKLDDFRFTSEGMTASGSFSIDTNRKVPYFEADLTTSEFHTNLILKTQGGLEQQAGTTQVSQKWDGGKFDFGLIESFDGIFRLRTPKLLHDGFELSKVDAQGKFINGTLRLDPLIGTLAGGDLTLKLDITGGAVPGMTSSFTLTNADSGSFFQYLPSLPVTGRMSANGAVKTTGINLYSWMINMEGSAAVVAKNLVFKGADVTGFARRITNIRSVADVVTVAKQAFAGGETMFSAVEGSMVIERGTATISNLQLRNDVINGLFRGRIDLPHWTGVGLAEMKLAVAGSGDTPTLAVKLSGSLDQPEIKIETADVETFVARRSTQQGLKPQ